jgi:MarR family transcriptional regulator, organic hydroperoxide resistance regulator
MATIARTAAPADEAWKLLRQLLAQQRRRFIAAASELDLHPAQAGALLQMEPEEPRPMHELAALLACDNSNVTGLIDRLEARGLVARQPYEQDRRVKHVVLTSRGEALRDRLLAQVGEPPSGLERLSAGEQRQLRDLLARVLQDD